MKMLNNLYKIKKNVNEYLNNKILESPILNWIIFFLN